MARNLIFSYSTLSALLATFSFFGHVLANFRIYDINGIPTNNQLPDIMDVILELPALFSTRFFIPKFENTDEVIILTNLIPDRKSPRVPLNVRYSASKDEWTRIADWNIEAGASEARRFFGPHEVESGSDKGSKGNSGINLSGNWMINFEPHGIVRTGNGVKNESGRRLPAYSLITNIIVTDPQGYQRYFKFGQELPCTDLGEHGLFCEQLIIELDDAADALNSDNNEEVKAVGKSELPPPLSLPLSDSAASADYDNDVDGNDYVPPAADLSNNNNDNAVRPASSSSPFQRQPGRPRRRFE